MKCHEVQRKLSAHMDNELDSTLRQGIADHLNGCDACREELEGFRNIDVTVGALPTLRTAPAFAENLVMRVSTEAGFAEEPPSAQIGFFGKVLSLVESFVELLEPVRSPRTLTLDEFSDFPPLSMGYVYCKLLGQWGGE